MDLATHVLALAKAAIELALTVAKALSEACRLRQKLKNRRH